MLPRVVVFVLTHRRNIYGLTFGLCDEIAHMFVTMPPQVGICVVETHSNTTLMSFMLIPKTETHTYTRECLHVLKCTATPSRIE